METRCSNCAQPKVAHTADKLSCPDVSDGGYLGSVYAPMGEPAHKYIANLAREVSELRKGTSASVAETGTFSPRIFNLTVDAAKPVGEVTGDD